MERGRQVFAHEVLLKRQRPLLGHEVSTNLVIAHWEYTRREAKTAAQLEGCFCNAAAAVQHLRAQDVGGKVAVANAKPCRLAQPAQSFQGRERVPSLPVPHRFVEHAGKAVDRRIHIRAHQQPPELVVISRVGDDREVARCKQLLEAGCDLGAARAAGQNYHLHRNTSSAAGRTRSRPWPSPVSSRPRMTTTGVRLSHHEARRGCEVVGDREHGRMHFPSGVVRRSAQVDQRGEPRNTQRHVDDAQAPRPPEGIRDDDANLDARSPANALANGASAGVRVIRQKRDDIRLAHIRLVDPGVGAHEAVPRLGDQNTI